MTLARRRAATARIGRVILVNLLVVATVAGWTLRLGVAEDVPAAPAAPRQAAPVDAVSDKAMLEAHVRGLVPALPPAGRGAAEDIRHCEIHGQVVGAGPDGLESACVLLPLLEGRASRDGAVFFNTDIRGVFVVSAVLPGPYLVLGVAGGGLWAASEPLLVSPLSPMRTSETRIVRAGVGRLDVVVKDQSSQPVKDCHVLLTVTGEQYKLDWPAVMTDRQGACSLMGLPNGDFHVSCEIGDLRASQSLDFRPAAEVLETTILIPPSACVRFSAQDPAWRDGRVRVALARRSGAVEVARAGSAPSVGDLICSPGAWDLTVRVRRRSGDVLVVTRSIELVPGEVLDLSDAYLGTAAR